MGQQQRRQQRQQEIAEIANRNGKHFHYFCCRRRRWASHKHVANTHTHAHTLSRWVSVFVCVCVWLVYKFIGRNINSLPVENIFCKQCAKLSTRPSTTFPTFRVLHSACFFEIPCSVWHRVCWVVCMICKGLTVYGNFTMARQNKGGVYAKCVHRFTCCKVLKPWFNT